MTPPPSVAGSAAQILPPTLIRSVTLRHLLKTDSFVTHKYSRDVRSLTLHIVPPIKGNSLLDMTVMEWQASSPARRIYAPSPARTVAGMRCRTRPSRHVSRAPAPKCLTRSTARAKTAPALRCEVRTAHTVKNVRARRRLTQTIRSAFARTRRAPHLTGELIVCGLKSNVDGDAVR